MGTKNPNESQFDEYRDWQWIKHLILREYAHRWAHILGSVYGHIVAVDACAGAGTYTNPDTGEEIAEGSARILARQAKAYTEGRGPGKTMHVICCEKNLNNYKALVRNVAPFEPHVSTMHGNFARHVPTIVKELGGSPALILLDPIGVATIPADLWRPLLERKGKTDLLIVLHFAGLHRIGGWLTSEGEPNPRIAPARRGAQTMDRVFNTKAWREIAIDPKLAGDKHREARERRYMRLFFENVIGDRHQWKCYCPVRARYGGPVKYWLLHASGSRRAYELMDEEVVKVNRLLLEREYRHGGTIDGFAELELEAELAHVEAQMVDAAFEYLSSIPGGTLPWGELDDRLLSRFFGRATPNVPWRVIKRLCGDDHLLRQKKKSAAADRQEMISLPDAIEPEADGAVLVPIRRVA